MNNLNDSTVPRKCLFTSDASAKSHFFSGALPNGPNCIIEKKNYLTASDSAMYAFSFQHNAPVECVISLTICSFSFKCVDYYRTMAHSHCEAEHRANENGRGAEVVIIEH